MVTQQELLFNRLSKRYKHLKKWARRTGINAFRLYDRDIPEIALVLDLYDDAVSGAVYKRPHEVDNESWLLTMKEPIARALDLPESRIFLKERRRMKQRQDTGVQYNRVSTRSFYRDVHEKDLRFRVNLSDYLDTGLFLDSRKKRAIIREEAEGKRVLNLFAYTCSLSVCAAKGGARQVDSVDLSNTYLEWGKVNFALNGLNAGYDREPLTLIRGDVIQFISRAEKARNRWDIIILDPPAFSNSKKTRGTLDIRRDYRDLIQRCLSLLNHAGTLWFSSNAKGVKLEGEEFPGFSVRDMRQELTDEDFRGKKTPACYTLKSKSSQVSET